MKRMARWANPGASTSLRLAVLRGCCWRTWRPRCSRPRRKKMDDSEARKARAERLREEIDALTNPPGDPAMIPGLRKALELAEQYRTYDLQNAEKLLDAE